MQTANGMDVRIKPMQTLAFSKQQRAEGIAISSSGSMMAIATADADTVLLYRRQSSGQFDTEPCGILSRSGIAPQLSARRLVCAGGGRRVARRCPKARFHHDLPQRQRHRMFRTRTGVRNFGSRLAAQLLRRGGLRASLGMITSRHAILRPQPSRSTASAPTHPSPSTNIPASSSGKVSPSPMAWRFPRRASGWRLPITATIP